MVPSTGELWLKNEPTITRILGIFRQLWASINSHNSHSCILARFARFAQVAPLAHICISYSHYGGSTQRLGKWEQLETLKNAIEIVLEEQFSRVIRVFGIVTRMESRLTKHVAKHVAGYLNGQPDSLVILVGVAIISHFATFPSLVISTIIFGILELNRTASGNDDGSSFGTRYGSVSEDMRKLRGHTPSEEAALHASSAHLALPSFPAHSSSSFSPSPHLRTSSSSHLRTAPHRTFVPHHTLYALHTSHYLAFPHTVLSHWSLSSSLETILSTRIQQKKGPFISNRSLDSATSFIYPST
ncbi:hypothetical protein BDZ91DRAFT_800069 [Kalaharituber pfeilii]|nr:hypothetical protein BDZ91DRAFT_800069 [Kalaharituber pfeilii]